MKPRPPTDEELVALRHRAKAELRTRIRAIRKAVPASAREARSAAIAEHVVAHEAFRSARVVLAYAAMRGEVDPAPVVEAAWSAGKRIALPRVDGERDELVLHVYERGDVLEESGMGFRAPLGTAPAVGDAEIDLVLVPCVAVDERGFRIGMGRAFYDRLLPRLGRATSMALAFDFQLLAEIPDTPGDVGVRYVVSDRGVLLASG